MMGQKAAVVIAGLDDGCFTGVVPAGITSAAA
jgi:hypothetical protein